MATCEVTLVLETALASLARPGRARCERLEAGPGRAAFSLRFRSDQSAFHLIELLGIPRCEIGEVRADGAAFDAALPAPDGSRLEVLPTPEPVDAGSDPCFVLDVHLGSLARTLRLLGFDVAWRNDFGDDELVDLALRQGRILLTRDRRLLFRRGVGRAMLVPTSESFGQVVAVAQRFGLAALTRPFSRCAVCGEPVRAATKAELSGLVPAIVAERYEEFYRCASCGKAYWKGDHFRTILPFLERLASALGTAPRA
jgi:uncharacterized protein with PIN domain